MACSFRCPDTEVCAKNYYSEHAQAMYYPEEVASPVVPVVLFLAEQLDIADKVKGNLTAKQVLIYVTQQ